MRQESLRSSTTTTSHGNQKGWVESTIIFEIRTLGYFPAKYHGCCTFHQTFWVVDVVSGVDY